MQTHNLYLTLVTLLFSYMYDSRTSQHDPTSESAWTICNLTPSFTALDPPLSSHYTGGCHIFSKDEIQETLVPSYRRSLAFPLYRSFLLSEKCREDIAFILRKGKRTVMRCLLEMKYILDHHEIYYIYSKIWLDDFCVWVQADARWALLQRYSQDKRNSFANSDDVLEIMGKTLMEVKLDKASIDWGLEEIESAAKQSAELQSDSDDETDGESDTA
jgi:protein SHQ1